MDISFIILNYKNKGLLQNCLQSILAADMSNLAYEIIVVDNASNDGVKEMLQTHFSNITFIASAKNLGMGGGNNLGVQQAKGKYLAIINPDTVVFNDTFVKLYNFMQTRPMVGVCGPKAMNPDSTLQYTRCRFHDFATPLYRRTPLKNLPFIKAKLDLFLTKDQDYDVATPTDWLFGLCLFVRQEVMAKLDGFDQRFFLGFEDTDLCRRVWQAGYEVWYYPQSVLIHYPHRFSGSGNWLTSLMQRNVRIHITSWLKYFWKYRTAKLEIINTKH